MDPAKVEAWQRFRDQVLSRSDWPRRLWFAAVEDALRAAFGADSRLLAELPGRRRRAAPARARGERLLP